MKSLDTVAAPAPPTPALAYATADDAIKPATGWIAVGLAGISLGLIVAGGCFLIGIGLVTGMLFNLPASFYPISDARTAFIILLGLCAAACFCAAVWLFILAVRRVPRA